MKHIFDVITDWEELIEQAKNECVFGDPLDTELFESCMKNAFETLSVGKERTAFDRSEMELYGKIFGYSCIPAVTESEDSTLFQASLYAAGDLAEALIRPERYRFEISRIMAKDEYIIDGEVIEAGYDFETGSLDNYIRLIEEGLLD
ncbi:MAG: hypothetical protein K5756_05660 [Clostridiales bacterium]|nr:hypothetical protein [Clostridiales bacterium]